MIEDNIFGLQSSSLKSQLNWKLQLVKPLSIICSTNLSNSSKLELSSLIMYFIIIFCGLSFEYFFKLNNTLSKPFSPLIFLKTSSVPASILVTKKTLSSSIPFLIFSE